MAIIFLAISLSHAKSWNFLLFRVRSIFKQMNSSLGIGKNHGMGMRFPAASACLSSSKQILLLKIDVKVGQLCILSNYPLTRALTHPTRAIAMRISLEDRFQEKETWGERIMGKAVQPFVKTRISRGQSLLANGLWAALPLPKAKIFRRQKSSD